MPPRAKPPEPPAAAEPDEPPFYEATAEIFYGSDPSVMPVRVANPGDRVPPDLVERHGWGGLVKIPERFAGQLAPPKAPETPPEGGSDKE